MTKPKSRSSALRRPIPKSALAAIQRDRWIGYPIGDAGLFRLNELYTMRARVRMPCLLIYGVSGAGKSMLLEKFKRDHAPSQPKRATADHCYANASGAGSTKPLR